MRVAGDRIGRSNQPVARLGDGRAGCFLGALTFIRLQRDDRVPQDGRVLFQRLAHDGDDFRPLRRGEFGGAGRRRPRARSAGSGSRQGRGGSCSASFMAGGRPEPVKPGNPLWLQVKPPGVVAADAEAVYGTVP